ncbi:MAG: asparagine synthase-related protein [bacterium]
MSKIPFLLKVRKGIVKWPLKKMLGNFMPENFIYRSKFGFVPSLAEMATG